MFFSCTGMQFSQCVVIVSAEETQGSPEAEVTNGSPETEEESASGKETAKTPVSEKRTEKFLTRSGESDVLRLDLSDDEYFSEESARKTNGESDEGSRTLIIDFKGTSISCDAKNELPKGSDYDDEELENSDRLVEAELLKSSDEESPQASGEKLLKAANSEEEMLNAGELLQSSDEESRKELLKSRYSEEELKRAEKELLQSSDEESRKELLRSRYSEEELKRAEKELLQSSDEESLRKELLKSRYSEEELKRAEKELLQSSDEESLRKELLKSRYSEVELNRAEEELLQSSGEELEDVCGGKSLKGSDAEVELKSDGGELLEYSDDEDLQNAARKMLLEGIDSEEELKSAEEELLQSNERDFSEAAVETLTEDSDVEGQVKIADKQVLKSSGEESAGAGVNLPKGSDSPKEERSDSDDRQSVDKNDCPKFICDGDRRVLGWRVEDDQNNNYKLKSDLQTGDPPAETSTKNGEAVVLEDASLSLEDDKPMKKFKHGSPDVSDEETIRLTEDGNYMVFSEHSDEDEFNDDDEVEIIFVQGKTASMVTEQKPSSLLCWNKAASQNSPNELHQIVENRVLSVPSQINSSRNTVETPHSSTANMAQDWGHDTRIEVKVEDGVTVGSSQSFSSENLEDRVDVTPRFKIESPEAEQVSPNYAEMGSETEISPEFSVRSEVGSSPDIGRNLGTARNPSPPPEMKAIPRIEGVVSPRRPPFVATPLRCSESPALFARQRSAPQQTDSGRSFFADEVYFPPGRQEVPLFEPRGPQDAAPLQAVYGGDQVNHGKSKLCYVTFFC